MARRALVALLTGAVVCGGMLAPVHAEEAAPPPYTLEIIEPPAGASFTRVGALLDDGSVYLTVEYPVPGYPYIESAQVMRWRDGEYTSMHGIEGLPPVQPREHYRLYDAAADDRLVGSFSGNGRHCNFALTNGSYSCQQDSAHVAINADGVAGGTTQGALDGYWYPQPHRLHNGIVTPLEDHQLGGAAADINGAGHLVGTLDDERPVSWQGDRVQPLVTMSEHVRAEASSISDLGRIAGFADTDPTYPPDRVPVLWQGSAIALLPSGPLAAEAGVDVNDLGQVLTYRAEADRAGLYHGSGVTPLRDLMPAGTTLQFTSSAPRPRLNASGQIAGTAIVNGHWTSFLLTPTVAPVPPATDLTAVQTGSQATLTWTRPEHSGIVDTIVRHSSGTVAPATPTDGNPVASGTGSSTVAYSLSEDTAHSFSVFMVAADGTVSAPTITSTVQRIEFEQVTISPGSATFRDTITARGRLVRSDTGAPLAGVPVALYSRYVVDEALTDAQGWVTLKTTAHSRRKFHLFTGGGGRWPAAASQTLPIELYQTPTEITLRVSRTDVDHDDGVTITGRLTDAATGAPISGVNLDLHHNHGDDPDLETDEDGRVRFYRELRVDAELRDSTEHRFRLSFGGFPSLAAADSPVKTVQAHMITPAVFAPARLPAAPAGSPRDLNAQLIRLSTGNPEPNRAVTLYSRAVGSGEWRYSRWDASDAEGRVGFIRHPEVSTEYRFVHDSSWGYNQTSAITYVPVRARLAPRLDRMLVRAGPEAETLVRGHLRPRRSDRTIKLERLEGEDWKPVSSTSTDDDGRYLFTLPVPEPIQYRYRLAVAGTTQYLGTTVNLPVLTGYRMRIPKVEPGGSLDQEWALLRNTGESRIRLGGWWLRTEAGAGLQLPLPAGFSLEPGQSIRVYTGTGDRRDVIYLNHQYPLWPNDGGAAQLRDPYMHRAARHVFD